MKMFIFCVPEKYHSSLVLSNEGGLLNGTCGSNGGENKLIQGFFLGEMRKKEASRETEYG
jgi:hypothetical protein